MKCKAPWVLVQCIVLAVQVGCTETPETGNTSANQRVDQQSTHTVVGHSSGGIDQIEPSDAAPFDEPIDLRFRPVQSFAYYSDKYMGGTGGPERFLWGYAMKGSVRESGSSLVWRYTIYNRGHDNVLRPCGEVEVVTDAFGAVAKSEVMSRDDECTSEASYLDSTDLIFPLCCLPSQPVTMGDMTRHWVITEMEQRALSKLPSGQKIVDGNRRRIAEGLVQRDGQDYLLVREQGTGTLQTDMGNFSGTSIGYHLIDTHTGMIRMGQRQTKIDLSNVSDRSGPGYVVVRSRESTVYSAERTNSPIEQQDYMALAAACEKASTPRDKVAECTRTIVAAQRLVLDPPKIEIILAGAHLLRAMGHFEHGNLEAAERDLQTVIRKDPSSFAAYHNLGEIKLARADWAGALADFDVALANAPAKPTPVLEKSIAQTHISRGHAFQQLGEMTPALEATGQAIALDPGNATAQNNMGFLYLQTGDYEQSVEHYEKAVALDPKDSQARAGLEEVRRRIRKNNYQY